jgi:hypothetical protein
MFNRFTKLPEGIANYSTIKHDGTHLRKNEQLTMSHQDMFCLTTSVSHTASKTGVLESVPSSPTRLSWCLSCFFSALWMFNYDI